MRADLLAAIVLLSCVSPAIAQTDLLSPDTFAGLVDLRLGASEGARSWTQGEFGKTRFSGGRDSFALRGQVADADLIWTPAVGDVTAVVDLEAQPGQRHGLELGQAYFLWKPVPTSETQVSVRAGLFYPPISMEHSGYAGGPWTVTATITPSAINAWVGQELKVVGLEPTLRTRLGDHEVSVSAAVFGDDDTAGALLALRGWSLDDVKGTAFGRLPLPPQSDFLAYAQASFTEPVREIDHRLGGYVRAAWSPPGPLQLNAIYYDNHGDNTGVDGKLQWAWATRFWNLGARFDVNADTRLIGQAMAGHTSMGYPRGRALWVDVDFASAYLLAQRDFGRTTLSARLDGFSNRNDAYDLQDDYAERGWAVTGDLRYALAPNVTLLAEALRVDSRRPQLAAFGLAPRQAQTTLQGALRLGF